MSRRAILFLLALILLTSVLCAVSAGSSADAEPVSGGWGARFLSELAAADPKTASFADLPFLETFRLSYGSYPYFRLYRALMDGTYDPDLWHETAGKTALVLRDEYDGVLDPLSISYRTDIRVLPDSDTSVICVIGDVAFADNYEIMPKLIERGQGLAGVLAEDLTERLRSADILLVNSEFALTNRGTPLPDKMYHFRGDPANVRYLIEMGTDIVTLANNHVYDFGEIGFSDTLATFRNARIPAIGAGEDLAEASKPFYFILNGRKYGFTAATRAEKLIRTPEAIDHSSGVLRMYDMTRYLQVIREAEAECDVNIAYVHWGKEKSHQTEDGLFENAVAMIEAGADVVIGAHAHVLQGIDYYDHVPIFYNLGNFLFDEATLDTAVLELDFGSGPTPSVRMIPCIQTDWKTSFLTGSDRERVWRLLRSLSPNVSIDGDGLVTEKNT
ncbi:MAG: CapA family protein [Clostridia bacterium]|nr:CapA family protein [Clostridia bacterium]